MRVSRTTPTLHGFSWAVRRTGALLIEGLLLAAPIAALEMIGPHSPHDGTDLVVLLAAGMFVFFLTRAARMGWMPTTIRAARKAKDLGARLIRGISPRYAVAFRPTPEVVPIPDRTLLLPVAVLTAALVGAALLGWSIFDGLLFMKQSVSYTLYLSALAALWSFLFVAIIFGSVATAHWFQGIQRSGVMTLAPVFFGVGWVAGLILILSLPGSTPLAVVLAAGALRARSLRGVPAANYLFCRRDSEGRARTIPVHVYLHRAHACIVLLLALIITLGQAQRLWLPSWPRTPFTFTTWLGLLATLCSLILVIRAGIHFQRILGGKTAPPETPLTPTLWLQQPEKQKEPWLRIAREGGWLALRGGDAPEHPYDLVMGDIRLGDPDHARRFAPRKPRNDEDARFLLERRFHVVMRRRFHRHFQGLYKRLRAEQPGEGSGYLFCPHVWLVPGVVRDVEPKSRNKSAMAGPVFYGPPYAQAFPHRVRRYIGSVLRDLQVDIMYWEDAVGWPDIRRVLGIAFEVHDQGRSPLEARHFIGIPRVRIVIQEEEADPEPTGDPLRPRKATLKKTAPGHARILLIVRDRGDHEELDVPDPVDNWIKTPSLV